MSKMDSYFDKWGLLTQSNGDGGDSLMFTAFYIIGELLWARKRGDIARELQLFRMYQGLKYHCVHPDGERVRRHPDPDMWYSSWAHGSGDQYQCLIILAGLFKDRKLLCSLLWGFVKRGFFTTNTRKRNLWEDKEEHEAKAPRWKKWEPGNRIADFRPFFIALFIRGLRLWPLYPVLWLTDAVDLVLGAVLKSSMLGIYNRKVRAGNDGNFLAEIYFGRVVMSTPPLMLASFIYHKFRLKIGEDTIIRSRPLRAIFYHYRKESRNPPLYLAWVGVVKA